MYKFKDVLTEDEIKILQKYNIPLECERNKEALSEIKDALIIEEISEDTERICDKLTDNLKI